ncbi:hypothetical protein DMENIID0001_152960 [Sergentomyia squamirostris]
MFKKLPPPPPMLSLKEIIEDMETFKVEKPKIPNPRNISAEENIELEVWWKHLDTFLGDVDYLKETKTRLLELRNHLQERNQQIEAQSTEIYEEIGNQLN